MCRWIVRVCAVGLYVWNFMCGVCFPSGWNLENILACMFNWVNRNKPYCCFFSLYCTRKMQARRAIKRKLVFFWCIYIHTSGHGCLCFLLGSSRWSVIAWKCFCTTSNFGNLIAATFTSLIWSLLKAGALNLNDPFCFLKLPFIRTRHGWSQSPVNSCF